MNSAESLLEENPVIETAALMVNNTELQQPESSCSLEQKVQLQLIMLQEMQYYHGLMSAMPASAIFYPTAPGALSVGKFPNPRSVDRLLGNNQEAQQFLSRKAQVIIRMRGLPYDATAKQVVSTNCAHTGHDQTCKQTVDFGVERMLYQSADVTRV